MIIGGVNVIEERAAYIKTLLDNIPGQGEGPIKGVILYGSSIEGNSSEDPTVDIVLVGTVEEFNGYQIVSEITDYMLDYDLDQDITCLYYKIGSPEIKTYLNKGGLIWGSTGM